MAWHATDQAHATHTAPSAGEWVDVTPPPAHGIPCPRNVAGLPGGCSVAGWRSTGGSSTATVRPHSTPLLKPIHIYLSLRPDASPQHTPHAFTPAGALPSPAPHPRPTSPLLTSPPTPATHPAPPQQSYGPPPPRHHHTHKTFPTTTIHQPPTKNPRPRPPPSQPSHLRRAPHRRAQRRRRWHPGPRAAPRHERRQLLHQWVLKVPPSPNQESESQRLGPGACGAMAQHGRSQHSAGHGC